MKYRLENQKIVVNPGIKFYKYGWTCLLPAIVIFVGLIVFENIFNMQGLGVFLAIMVFIFFALFAFFASDDDINLLKFFTIPREEHITISTMHTKYAFHPIYKQAMDDCLAEFRSKGGVHKYYWINLFSELNKEMPEVEEKTNTRTDYVNDAKEYNNLVGKNILEQLAKKV